jgi:hypothetical protein
MRPPGFLRFYLLAACLLFIEGCGAGFVNDASLLPPPPPGPIVTVEKTADGLWSATWHLAEPTRVLRFQRPGSFRSRIFQVVTPGFQMERDGEVELLRTHGAPASVITVRFPEYDRQLTREYEFFRKFTDGSAAIYTGHLVARPQTPATPPQCDSCYIRQFEFMPPPGAAVIVDGRRVPGRTPWTDASGRDTYVYMGAIAPVATDDVISVIDPGLPAWLGARTRDALPRLFALYRKRLDAKLPTRPVVLFDYKPGSSAGYSSGGGTLPGLIQLGVEGRAWEKQSYEAMRQLLHFLAHESAHLWNGEIAHYPGTEDAWMHEGSADALAERALVELGVIGEPHYLDYQTRALNDCRRGLTTTPLRASVRRGQPALAYTCGNMIALLTERSLDGRRDLFAFWRRLIARAQRNGGTYEAEDYKAVWREMGAQAADVSMLDRFLDGNMDPPGIADALATRGVTLADAEPPPAYRQSVARDAFARLMSADCDGRVGFRMADNGFLVDDNVACTAITAGSVVVSIGGVNVVREGDRAYDAVSAMCGAKTPVPIALSTGDDMPREVHVSCNGLVPPRPAYLAIKAIERERS